MSVPRPRSGSSTPLHRTRTANPDDKKQSAFAAGARERDDAKKPQQGAFAAGVPGEVSAHNSDGDFLSARHPVVLGGEAQRPAAATSFTKLSYKMVSLRNKVLDVLWGEKIFSGEYYFHGKNLSSCIRAAAMKEDASLTEDEIQTLISSCKLNIDCHAVSRADILRGDVLGYLIDYNKVTDSYEFIGDDLKAEISKALEFCVQNFDPALSETEVAHARHKLEVELGSKAKLNT